MSLTSQWRNKFFEVISLKYISQSLAYDKDAITLKLPGYLQTEDYTCGWVAGLMVLHRFYPEADENLFLKQIRPHIQNGTSTTKLVQALRANNIGVRVHNDLKFSTVVESIKNGSPIITCIEKGDDDHWIVIYGVKETPKEVYVAGNSLLGTQTYTWVEFRKLMRPRGFGLVCCKRTT
jgi:hypothetical protein